MNKLLSAFGFLLLAQIALSDDSSHFELDKDLVNSIYKDAITEAKIETRRRGAGLRVAADFSYVIPTSLTLSNQYFDVPYGEGFAGLPSFGIALMQGFWNPSRFNFSFLGRTGFSRKDALINIKSKSGGSYKDVIQLSRIPLLAGMRVEWAPTPTFPIKPFFEGGAGIQWFYQSGKLDKSLEQGFFIPFYQVTMGITLFGNSEDAAWLGGVNLGGSIQRSFNTAQATDSWSLDAGVVFYL